MRPGGFHAQPTLRLREGDLPDPPLLRVFRKEPNTGIGADLGISPLEIKIVDFEKGKGISFPITRFGSYVVALEKDR